MSVCSSVCGLRSCICINPTPQPVQEFNRYNSVFSFSYNGCQAKVKEPTLPYYLSITGDRIVGCVPFLKVLAQYEMQTASSRF